MMLASVHTIWMREHNRIANQLSVINPGWNDERVFMETRKIVIAILQHITYLEWLPVILNPRIMRDFRLWPFLEGYRNEYDRFIDPSIRNSFGAAAFRFGHTLVNSPVSKAEVNFATSFSQRIPLNTMFGAVDQVLQDQGASVDSFVRGLLVDRPQSFDRFVTNVLTNRLFEDGRGNALDLIALNIQRGRDHGIPTYNVWRQWCGLPLIQNFGTGAGGFDNHPFDAIRALQTVYA